ncbi:MAG: hypothetical protein JO146_03600, partial [Candidatus Eremiobacteraeota bacterium]|nr:hypothetical protein [Candidatus Eremiobacteraeota bacterium]
MAVPQQPSGIKNGWRFYVPVIVGIASGVLLIAAADVLGRTHLISSDVRDAGLVVGGALLGLVALALDELYRTGPALRRMRRERETEFAR